MAANTDAYWHRNQQRRTRAVGDTDGLTRHTAAEDDFDVGVEQSRNPRD